MEGEIGPLGKRMEERPNPKAVMTVRKVRVAFPFAPYRAQLALMFGVVGGLQNKQHSLLESPTGTGKSMALLCSALAWQRGAIMTHEAEMREWKLLQEAEGADQVVVDLVEGGEVKVKVKVKGKKTKVEGGAVKQEEVKSEMEVDSGGVQAGVKRELKGEKSLVAGVKGEPRMADTADDDDDFVEAKPARDAAWQNKRPKGAASSSAAVPEQPANAALPPELQNARMGDFAGATGDPRKPKAFARIFYSSRTHSQLTQVVSELKRSGYRPKMTLLASRGEYCMHPVVKRKGASKNDDCLQLVQDSACGYYNNQDDVVHAVRSAEGPHDIEDLLTVGKDHRGCPYYAAVELAKDAELILCPYNYLLDVGIRNARDIHVNGDILIFDEAHNIEDHAREAASFTGNILLFSEASAEVTQLTVAQRVGPQNSEIFNAYQTLKVFLLSMSRMVLRIIDSGGLVQESSFGGTATEISKSQGAVMVSMLNGVSIGMEEVARYRKAAKTIWDSRDEDYTIESHSTMEGFAFGSQGQAVDLRRKKKMKGGDGKRPSWKGLGLCDGLLHILTYALENEDSYVMALMRKTGGFEAKTELNFWCLNAAVPFHALKTSARSIVVTSGTLTPLSSFRGELGVDFGTEKSLPHVVDVQKQVFTAVVARGPAPGFVNMDSTYRNAANFDWQDGLGCAIVDYCKVIPGGVLVFFPSYRLLNNLSQRWQEVGIWEQLEAVKGLVMIESSGRGRESTFDTDIISYREHAAQPDGAVMMGVCRGKISEGVDFKDSAARGVLVIGIPYPAAKDPLLLSKREWNDCERKQAGRDDVMPGQAWYEMQAFRALNQAVGRCIRHRRDFGAIVLLDQRFRSARTFGQLPDWVRGGRQGGESSSHEATVQGLTTFFANVENNLPSS